MASKLYGEPGTGDPFTDRRRTGIGGSDAGAILGVSPYASALSVWEQKRGLVNDPFVVSERMVWGTRLEGAIVAGYAEDTGRKVRRGGRAFRRHPTYEWVIGHPDAETQDGRLVEVKTSHSLDGWGEDGSADIPPAYYAQVQHYLILTGRDVCDVPLLRNGREYHLFTVPANRVYQEAWLDEGEAFWRRVIDGDPPPPDGSESAGAALRRLFPRAVPESVVATPEVGGYAESYLDAKDQRDEQQRAVDHYAQLIQRFMGARERVIGPGFTGTWSNRAGSVSWKSVAEELRVDIQLAASVGDPNASTVLLQEWDTRLERWRSAPTRVFSLSRKDEA
jgi:putative phage-type endonuclease